MHIEWKRLRRGFERAVWWVAVLLPGIVAAIRAAPVSSWRDDFGAVQALGMVSVGGPATLSALLQQLVSFIPLGPLWHRMALSSAAMLVVTSFLMMRLSLVLLEANVRGSFVNVPLAAMATLALGLGPTLQREGTVGSSVLVTVVLALWAFVVVSTRRSRETSWTDRAILGGLAGAVSAHSPLAGGVLVVALVVSVWIGSTRKLSRGWWIPIASFLTLALVLWAPFLVRMYAPGAWIHAGVDADLSGLRNLDTARHVTSAWTAWHENLGTLLVIVGVFGLLVGMLRARLRVATVPLLVFLVLDLAAPASSGGILAVDPLTTVRTIAIVALAVASALGLQTIVATLFDMGLPLSRAAAVLILLLDLTLVGVASESSEAVADRSQHDGTDLFNDIALRPLPPRSMLLVRSQPMVWRLLAAQLIDGVRPDVLVTPYPLLKYRGFAAHLLVNESSSTLLLRDVVLEGTPGEHAMSRLADHRPLFVQLDPAWNQRLMSHLAPAGPWLSLSPQPVGKSERRMAAKTVTTDMKKWIVELQNEQPPDEATLGALRARHVDHALAAAAAKDPQSALDILLNLEALFPNDVVVRSLRQRLDFAQGQSIDVSGLCQ